MNATILTPEQIAEKRQSLINRLAEDLKETVQGIEAKPPTTQHHYGDYGSLMSRLAEGNRTVATVISQALIKAGANPIGVAHGFKLFC